jgi:hypothetical protein
MGDLALYVLQESNHFNQYIDWTITSSYTYITYGVISGIVGSYLLFKHPFKLSEDFGNYNIFLGISLLFFSSLLISYNIPDIISPEAPALHYLLEDLLPKP